MRRRRTEVDDGGRAWKILTSELTVVAVVSLYVDERKVQDKLRGVPQNVRDDDSFSNTVLVVYI